MRISQARARLKSKSGSKMSNHLKIMIMTTSLTIRPRKTELWRMFHLPHVLHVLDVLFCCGPCGLLGWIDPTDTGKGKANKRGWSCGCCCPGQTVKGSCLAARKRLCGCGIDKARPSSEYHVSVRNEYIERADAKEKVVEVGASMMSICNPSNSTRSKVKPRNPVHCPDDGR